MDIMDHILSLLVENRLTDITLKVGGRNFPTHRVVIAAGSRYFNDLLTHDDTTISVVEFPDFNPDVFKYVLDFIYGACNVNFDDITTNFEFIRQCHYFRVTGIKYDQFLHPNEIPVKMFIDYIELLTTIFQDKIPTRHQISLCNLIHRGADLSQLSDEILLSLLPAIEYVPENLLDFHGDIEKMVADGRSPKLFSLINYQLLPPEYRPSGREENGPIPTFYMDEEKNWRSLITRIVTDVSPQTSSMTNQLEETVNVTTVVVADKSGQTQEIHINTVDNVRVGDVLVLTSSIFESWFTVKRRGSNTNIENSTW